MPLNLPAELRLQIYDDLFDLCCQEIADHAKQEDRDCFYVPFPGDRPPVNLSHVAECAIPNADPEKGPSTFSHHMALHTAHGLMLADRGSLAELRHAKSRYQSRMIEADSAWSPGRRSTYSAELRITQDGPRDADWTASLSWTFLPFFTEPPFDIEFVIRLDGRNPSLTQQFNPAASDGRSSGQGSKMALIFHILSHLAARGPPFASLASFSHVLERLKTSRIIARAIKQRASQTSLTSFPGSCFDRVPPPRLLERLHIKLVFSPLSMKSPKHQLTRSVLHQSHTGARDEEDESEPEREYAADGEVHRSADAMVIMGHLEGQLRLPSYTHQWADTTRFTWHGDGGKARAMPGLGAVRSHESTFIYAQIYRHYPFSGYLRENGY